MVESSSHNKDKKILVVDDYALTREMVRSILKNVGYKDVVHAVNGRTALAELEKETFDLIICDWNMPGLTGYDVLQKVRKSEINNNIPFLLLTAEAERDNVVKAIQSGVSDFISKPFTPGVLLEKVEAIFKAKV
jgi:two-component system chemotaxis response regulator CheY